MADDTNAGTPGAGTQLSGEATRAAAVKRLQKLQQVGMIGGRMPRTSGLGGMPARGTAVNTGPSGLPKPGAGLRQAPGLPSYSPHPPKAKRI